MQCEERNKVYQQSSNTVASVKTLPWTVVLVCGLSVGEGVLLKRCIFGFILMRCEGCEQFGICFLW
jgi:hypothetical protein